MQSLDVFLYRCSKLYANGLNCCRVFGAEQLRAENLDSVFQFSCATLERYGTSLVIVPPIQETM